jgi:hypothetical protein
MMATTLPIERLEELAQEGAAAMIVVPADERDRRGDWTHAAGHYRELREGGVQVQVFSRASGLLYQVTADYCTCPHYERRCQLAGEAVACKHVRFFFPGGQPPVGATVETLAERAEKLARELAEDLG